MHTGLTGRKIVVDTYGGWSVHGGGAFSGKDPTKVDRSAGYMTRYIAKNIAAAGLAGSVWCSSGEVPHDNGRGYGRFACQSSAEEIPMGKTRVIPLILSGGEV